MKHKRLAGLLWLSQIQYFIVQGLVTVAWNNVTANFSLRQNTISDLGNSAVGLYGGRFVHSPWHLFMNVSFVVLGLTMAAGALLLLQSAKLTRHKLGYTFLILGGIGTIVVGLFPENVPGPYHSIGAGLPFVLGNVGIILLASQSFLPLWLQRATYIAAALALVSLLAFASGTEWLLGLGGYERVTAYMQTVWMIIVGAVLLRCKQ